MNKENEKYSPFLEEMSKKELFDCINNKKPSTTQLVREQEHRTYFNDVLCPRYGMIEIAEWGSGSKNKKENCDADVTVVIIDIQKFNELECAKNLNVNNGDKLRFSLKTKGGNFTIANGGTGLRSELFKYMISKEDTEVRKEFKLMLLKIKEYKNKLGKDNRWEDIGQEKKIYIKQILCEFYSRLFYNVEYCKKLYEWLNNRKSELKCVDDKIFIPEKNVLPDLCKPEYIGDDTVIVGHYKLRVKAESGKVRSSWKINYEINQL